MIACTPETIRTFAPQRMGARQCGYTLVEMVMVILVVGLLSITLARLVSSGVFAFAAGREVVDVLSELRLTSERLARELRTVRRDPAAPTEFDFASRSAGSVQFGRLENDGTTVTSVTISAGPPLTLSYSNVAGGTAFPLSTSATGLTFRYLQANGTTLASAWPDDSDVAFVEFELTLQDSEGNSYPQRTRVALRNRQ